MPPASCSICLMKQAQSGQRGRVAITLRSWLADTTLSPAKPSDVMAPVCGLHCKASGGFKGLSGSSRGSHALAERGGAASTQGLVIPTW